MKCFRNCARGVPEVLGASEATDPGNVHGTGIFGDRTSSPIINSAEDPIKRQRDSRRWFR